METKTIIKPKLTLVGAGPGDPDLISLKGVKALNTADVVLYDALVNTTLLEHVPPQALKISVGKRKGEHSKTQQQINSLIVYYAFTYGHVVRLKGGDPFVFGRGGEEIQHAKNSGIETAVVPGISSSISIPALHEIPVTHRGTSESFWVIAGTTSSGELSEDVKTAARTNATAVILMGVGKLAEIINIYKANNKHALPVAVIQNGSLPNEKIALGTIDTILEETKNNSVGAPAVIVIGEVVQLHRQWNLPKEGVRLMLN